MNGSDERCEVKCVCLLVRRILEKKMKTEGRNGDVCNRDGVKAYLCHSP